MPLYTKNKNRILSFISLAMLIGVFGVSCLIALNAWSLSKHYHSVRSNLIGLISPIPLELSLPPLILLLSVGMIGAIIKEVQDSLTRHLMIGRYRLRSIMDSKILSVVPGTALQGQSLEPLSKAN